MNEPTVETLQCTPMTTSFAESGEDPFMGNQDEVFPDCDKDHLYSLDMIVLDDAKLSGHDARVETFFLKYIMELSAQWLFHFSQLSPSSIKVSGSLWHGFGKLDGTKCLSC